MNAMGPSRRRHAAWLGRTALSALLALLAASPGAWADDAPGSLPPSGVEEILHGHALVRASVVRKTNGAELRGIILFQTARGVLLAREDGAEPEWVRASEIAGVEPAGGVAGGRQWASAEAAQIARYPAEVSKGAWKLLAREDEEQDVRDAPPPPSEPSYDKEQMRRLFGEVLEAQKGRLPREAGRARLLLDWMRMTGIEIPRGAESMPPLVPGSKSRRPGR